MTKIKVLFEDDEALVIMKPSGIAVHKDASFLKDKKKDLTIADWFAKKYPKSKDVGESMSLPDGTEIKRPGIVHRLDKETSGALILAKTESSFYNLKAQFQNREIKKTYHAFVYGTIRDPRGIIDRKIGRADGDARKWAVDTKARGELRDAQTKFKVLKLGKDDGKSFSFLEVWPLTGRTHQIRVHMNSIGHPVIADYLYAPLKEKMLGFKRLALHASRVVFHSINGQKIEVQAPFPEDFEGAIKSLS